MEPFIATPRNTYAKRQRDQEKKQRADLKRQKRAQRKDMDKPTGLHEEQSTLPPTQPDADTAG